MGIFKYCSSRDELGWYVHPDYELNIYLSAEQLAISKLYFRKWIEEVCFGTVYACNNVSLPDSGESNWVRKIIPKGDATFYFSDPRDYTLFKLKYG